MQLPIDLNPALSLLARPIPTAALPPCIYTDPSTILALSQQIRTMLPPYPVVSLQTPIPVTAVTPVSGPTPQKRPARHSSVPTSPSCSSSVTSSSPQSPPHRKQAAPVPDDKKVSDFLIKIFFENSAVRYCFIDEFRTVI